jgi:hypothetical protein
MGDCCARVRELFRVWPQAAGHDLIVIENAEVAAAFKGNFAKRFASGEALSVSVKQ